MKICGDSTIKTIKKIFSYFKQPDTQSEKHSEKQSVKKQRKKQPPLPKNANIIPRTKHNISRKVISDNALKVLHRLQQSGYSAYLVGGGVRDLLLGREPKDFDIVTDAKPHEIKRCFRNGILIGRRFRLVHVRFRNEVIEVCTFRGTADPDLVDAQASNTGMILRDNVYGTIVEDAVRRDFTVNALFYNIADFSVIDFHQGIADLKQGILRIIGDPETRYREDPVRLLRAVRLTAKLGFRIHEQTEKPIFALHHLLKNVPPARVFTEILKMFHGGVAVASFTLLRHYGLFSYLFKQTKHSVSNAEYKTTDTFIINGLTDTDKRISAGKTVTPAYLLAVMLWYPLQNNIKQKMQKTDHRFLAFIEAMSAVIREQNKQISAPRRFIVTMREIWILQERFQQRKRRKLYSILQHPRFRAGYDFLLLRARSGENIKHITQWWTQFYEADETTRKKMMNQLGSCTK